MTDRIEMPASYVTGVLGAAGGYDDGHLIATDDPRRFCGIATFLKAPLLEHASAPMIGIVGIPFDGGSSRMAGARFGPRGVREASFRISGYNAELDVRPHDVHSIADCGDILVSPFSVADTYRSIERGAKSLLDRGLLPIAVGGDHSVTLPLLRAIRTQHGPVALVHFDAHCDVSDTQFGQPYHYGSVFRRAVEEGLIAEGSIVRPEFASTTTRASSSSCVRTASSWSPQGSSRRWTPAFAPCSRRVCEGSRGRRYT